MAPAARPPISSIAIAAFHNDGEQQDYYEHDNTSMLTAPLLQHYDGDNTISMRNKNFDKHGVGNGYYCLACSVGLENCPRHHHAGRRPCDKARSCLGLWCCRSSKGTRYYRYDKKERGSTPPQERKWRLFWKQHHFGVSTMLDWIMVLMDRMRCLQRKQRYEEVVIISPLASSLHLARTSTCTKNRTRVV